MYNRIVSTFFNGRKKTLGPLALAAFLGAVAGSAPALSQTVQMQTDNMAKITVHADGAASVKPDMALLNLSVSHEAATAKAAMDETSRVMTQVMSAMKAAGIAEKDMQTVGLAVQPVYQSDDHPSRKPRQRGYQASNTLSIKVRDLGKLGKIVDDAMAGGANGINQMTLTNANLQPLYDEARKNAVANAMAKAKLFADAAGVTLGRIWRIEENSSAAMPMMARASMVNADTPIAAGENSYNVNISLTMELLNKKQAPARP